jgi:membrane-associated phospholipid phosphatase
LAQIRTGKENLPALPTSTIPSAHIFWASIVGYYLFRTKKWLGWITLPVLLASSFGTVLLAQHYFLDIPAGMAVAAIAIWLAEGIGREKKG